MDHWFTIEQIDGTTFAISEYGHWEQTHCYLLIGAAHAVLIDTGLGVANIKTIVETLTTLPILVLTTHVHWDHIGGHSYFRDFAVHQEETQWISGQFPLPLSAVKQNLTLKPCSFPSGFHIDDYHIFQGIPTRILQDGETIDFGDRQLTVIHTPGHSPGHCCFYEQGRRYLFSGDLIYRGCLDAFYPSTDPLAFMTSVDKLKTVPVSRIFPSHHDFNLSANLIEDISDAFHQLHAQNILQQGSGIFDFGSFQIHI